MKKLARSSAATTRTHGSVGREKISFTYFEYWWTTRDIKRGDYIIDHFGRGVHTIKIELQKKSILILPFRSKIKSRRILGSEPTSVPTSVPTSFPTSVPTSDPTSDLTSDPTSVFGIGLQKKNVESALQKVTHPILTRKYNGFLENFHMILDWPLFRK